MLCYLLLFCTTVIDGIEQSRVPHPPSSVRCIGVTHVYVDIDMYTLMRKHYYSKLMACMAATSNYNTTLFTRWSYVQGSSIVYTVLWIW